MKSEMYRPKLWFGASYKMQTSDDGNNSERGDTLIEVLITLVVISLCVIAFLIAFTTSITASAKHRTFVSLDTVLRTVSENAQSQIELQVNPLYVSCATPATYQNVNFGAPSGYTTQISSVTYWSGSSFVTQCTSGSTAPQLIDISVTNSLGISSSISIVVDDPAYSAPASDASYQISTAENKPLGPPNTTVETSTYPTFTAKPANVQNTGTFISLFPGCWEERPLIAPTVTQRSGVRATATSKHSDDSSSISRLIIRRSAEAKIAEV